MVRGGHKTFTTTSDDAGHRPEDLVKRNFNASAPNRLWVADLTYVWTWSGFAVHRFRDRPCSPATSSAGGWGRRWRPSSPVDALEIGHLDQTWSASR